jgi:hypothetical protein
MNDFSIPRHIGALLRDLPCTWGVAGGWALDLFIDRVTRHHHDIEIAIFRQDQHIIRDYLGARGWVFEKVVNRTLHPWPSGEMLELPVHEIWCRSLSGPLERLEILLNERNTHEFIFRREESVRLSIERAFIESKSGVPALAPEIVLLYKSRCASDEKELIDFERALEYLDRTRLVWLYDNLARVDPGHAWLLPLKGKSEL